MTNTHQRWGAAALMVAVLATAGCGAAPGEAQPQNAPAGKTGKAGKQAEAAAEFARVDGSLVKGLSTATYQDPKRQIRAEVPTVDSARNVTSAMQVVRDKMLRTAAHGEASGVTIGWTLNASGPDVLGLMIDGKSVVGGATVETPSAVWYDAKKKRVYSSPILIDREQWGSFKNAVAEAATDSAIDKARLSRALDSDPAPMGSGPAIGFNASGDAVVAFGSGAAADQPVKVKVPAKAVKPLLSELGQAAQAGATKAAPFAGDPAETAAPATASPSAKASGKARSAGTATPGSTATPAGTASPTVTPSTAAAAKPSGSVNQIPRPSTAVGPDCTKLECVALTYDDGPGVDTPKVIEALRKENVPATFFQLGQMIKANPEIAHQLVSAGNEFGSHSYSHPDLARISPAKMNHELSSTADLMQEVYGQKPMLLRPPYGSHNKAVDAYAASLGAAVIQWDTDTNDWKTRNTAQTVAAAAKAKPGSMVLMHDIHPSTVAAAPEIISALKARNITLVTVTELSLNSGTYQAGHAYCSGTTQVQSGFNCAG